MIVKIQEVITFHTEENFAAIEKLEALKRKVKRYEDWLRYVEGVLNNVIPTIEEGMKGINYRIDHLELESAHMKENYDYLNEMPSIQVRLLVTPIGRRKPLKRELSTRTMTTTEWDRINASTQKSEQSFFEATTFKLNLNEYTMHKDQHMATLSINIENKVA